MNKKIIFRLVCVLAILICLPVCLTGCASSQVSYDTVVCSYSWSPSYGTIYECFTRTYTVYADNRIVVSAQFSDDWTGNEYYDEVVYEITEKEKQAVISAVRKNRIALMGDISTPVGRRQLQRNNAL